MTMDDSSEHIQFVGNTICGDYVMYDENDNLIYKDKDHPYINIFKRLEAIEKKLDELLPELG